MSSLTASSTSLPRVRDFRGINPNSFDGRGNYNMGIREQLIFPEIDYDKIDKGSRNGHLFRNHSKHRRGIQRAFKPHGRPVCEIRRVELWPKLL